MNYTLDKDFITEIQLAVQYPLGYKDVEEAIRFDGGSAFDALDKASQLAGSKGYHVAPLCSPIPTVAMSKTEQHLRKWDRMPREQQLAVDGILYSHDFRNGPVWFIAFKEQI